MSKNVHQDSDEIARVDRGLEELATESVKFHSHLLNRIVVPRSFFLRYFLGLAIFGVSLAIRWLAFPIEAGPHFMFYPALIFVALLCGTGATFLMTALSSFAAVYFFTPPYHSLALSWESWTPTAIFISFAVLVSVLIKMMKTTLESSAAFSRQLERTMNELKNEIAERKQSSQYARSLIEASLDPLVTISPDGLIMDVNAATVAVTGLAREALIGSDFSSYFTEPNKAREGYLQVFSEGFVADYPLTVEHRDGKLTDVLYNASIYRDVTGKVAGVFAAARDITERRQMESKLDAERDRLAQIMDISPVGISYMDAQGRVTYSNKMAEEISASPMPSGGEFDTTIHMWRAATLDGEPYPAEELPFEIVRKTQKSVSNIEYALEFADGNRRIVSVSGSPILGKKNEFMGMVGAVQDISERKKNEQFMLDNLVELENAITIAEKANLAKSEFLSSMSHELRTPLNAILGFAQLLDGESPSPVQKMSIDQIMKAGWHLLELINQILDLAVIESGKASMSIEPISLSLVLQDCQNMIAPQAHSRGIGITFRMPEQPCYVRADSTRLKQVMINLLSNAIKYNRKDGTVIVQQSKSDENRVRVSVIDSGDGLTPEQVAHLFQPFNRLGREAGVEDGTGIGLVVTKQLVELMNGTVGVESSAGVGSTFWIDLEAVHTADLLIHDVTENNSGAHESFFPETLSKPGTILYVEDEPANLLLIEQLIARRSNFKFLSANDGSTGYEMACALLPDLILMDVNLPGISGYDALALLQGNPATAHIPVIALSANAMARDLNKGLQAGFFSYLTKPIKVTEFMDALDVALLHVAENKQAQPAE